MNKNIFVAGVVAIAALAVFFFKFGPSSTNSGVSSSAPSAFVDGQHYRTVEQRIPSSGAIQVQEFFWYGCPHCQKFEPVIRDYKKSLPDDVELVQIPVTWNEATSLHAAMHYVAMESTEPEELQDDLFEKIISIRKEGNLERHIDEVEPVFAKHGVNATKLRERLHAPDVQKRVKEASEMMQSAQISGTPSVMVSSRWVVLNNEDVSKAGAFNVIDHLIEKARTAQ